MRKIMIPVNQQINRIGKYLYRRIDGTYKYKQSSNTVDLYVKSVFYHTDGYPDKTDPTSIYGEVKFNISITTYQNKIRVNVISMDPLQKTLGYDLYQPEIAQDLQTACKLIFQKIAKRLTKAYPNCDFFDLWIYGDPIVR